MIKDNFKHNYQLLTKREIEIIEHLNENISSIDNFAITNIAAITFSSTSSISRLVQKLELSYEDFKFILIRAKDEALAIRNKQMISMEDINRSTNIILNANRVFIVGVGQSRYLCKYLNEIFFKIGIFTNIITESDYINSLKSIAKSTDVVIFITASGNTQTLLNVKDHIQESKVKSICITGNPLSRLAMECDAKVTSAYRLISRSDYSFSLQGDMLKTIDELIVNIIKEYDK